MTIEVFSPRRDDPVRSGCLTPWSEPDQGGSEEVRSSIDNTDIRLIYHSSPTQLLIEVSSWQGIGATPNLGATPQRPVFNIQNAQRSRVIQKLLANTTQPILFARPTHLLFRVSAWKEVSCVARIKGTVTRCPNSNSTGSSRTKNGIGIVFLSLGKAAE
ncbi:hypothetical protein Agabi119p4_9655 [Agaricus bisporus var. burnettii]|uniref:Uncharacterized protein n=1 Tax=Agaricus bisporus var. burnettii TaxID=192524 RepID=A0A8H7EWU2_AGABI|nr:hypothetical protein Agabi119p4_9655 [Agaricus bisporus var. burnettii]